MSGRTARRRNAPAWVTACIAILATAAPWAQDESFWSFLENGRTITRCSPRSPAFELARSRLASLDARIDALKGTDSPAPAVGALHDLIRTECFLSAAETSRIPTPDTVLSLKQWWRDNGGREWVASLLELPLLGPTDRLVPHVLLPPDTRKTLHLEAHRDHPLLPLLCPLGDSGSCGAETRGWIRRAETYFEGPPAHDPNDGRNAATADSCAVKSAGADPNRAYQQWRDCVENERPLTKALPLGAFKAPANGWVVITGRRGHYGFCDTSRAYDLETGTAFVHDSCSSLVLKTDGRVDFAATDRRRTTRVAAGRIQVSNVQEAVWMMLFRSEAEDVQLRVESYPIPANLKPQLTIPVRHEESWGRAFWGNTAQTTLAWRWIPPAGPVFRGQLTWPNSYDAAEAHAAALLGIAEEAFTEGCVRQRPPSRAMLGTRTTHTLNRVDHETSREFEADWDSAAAAWAALPPCGP